LKMGLESLPCRPLCERRAACHHSRPPPGDVRPGAIIVQGRSPLASRSAKIYRLFCINGQTEEAQSPWKERCLMKLTQTLATAATGLLLVSTLGLPAAQASVLQHVFVITLENTDASQIYGNTTDAPYINS